MAQYLIHYGIMKILDYFKKNSPSYLVTDENGI